MIARLIREATGQTRRAGSYPVARSTLLRSAELKPISLPTVPLATE